MSLTTHINDFPKQRLPLSKKTEAWRIENVEAGIKLIGTDNNRSNNRRSSQSDKQRNYSLYNGHFDQADMDNELQSIDTDGKSFPAKPQYRDMASPSFNLLFGEEIKRGTNFIVRGSGDDTHSTKQNIQRDLVVQMLDDQVGADAPLQNIEEIEKYMSYSYEDIRESVGTKALNFLFKEQKLKQKFSKGFEHALLAAEEIYSVDMISNEPIVRVENPLGMSFLLAPDSDLIDDADLIVKATYMSVGSIIDDFYEDLSQKEIDKLEDITSEDKSSFGQSGGDVIPVRHFEMGEEENVSTLYGGYGFLDDEGNVLVAKVVWKSRKKIGFLTYLDENGDQQETVVSEDYKPDKTNPDESVEWKWINEYWEGTRIAEDIYINMRPRKNQFRRMDNLSACKSGFVGTVYNANNSRATSLMDRLVPWIYLYVTMWYRTELLIAANQGKIALIDISLIPDGWEMEKWLYYASTLKFGFVDSFNEGKKGQSTGKLAGNISTQNKVLDMETGRAILEHIGLLDYIEDKMGDLSGVTPQRKGAISAREAVGNVEKTIIQSSHITEKWFQIHNDTIQRVLTTLMDVAKDAWVDQTKKFQYVADDMASVLFEIDGNEFINSEFGVFVTDSSKDQEALSTLKQLTQAALQNDKIAFSDVASIYNNNSLADITNKLKASEAERAEQASAQGEAELAARKEEHGTLLQQKEQERTDKNFNEAAGRDNKKEIAIIGADNRIATVDANRNDIPDAIEREYKDGQESAKLGLDREKEDNRKVEKDRDQDLAEKKQREDAELKRKEIAAKSKEKPPAPAAKK